MEEGRHALYICPGLVDRAGRYTVLAYAYACIVTYYLYFGREQARTMRGA
jgi:hypothetical protein